MSCLTGEIVLSQPQKAHSMVIASAWKENPRAFYYNQKIHCMPAVGAIEVGGQTYRSVQHQVFGYFNGYMVFDDGARMRVRNLLGFAEDVLNQW